MKVLLPLRLSEVAKCKVLIDTGRMIFHTGGL